MNETEEKLEEKYRACVKSLESKTESERTSDDIHNIQTYLNTLLYFRRLKLFDPINVDNTVINISKVIRYVSIPKNNYVLKLGEKGNAFYLILKGKVSIMVAEYKKVYLTIEDYLIFLLKLFYFKEKEFLKETIILNKHRYLIEGNFENFIKDLYVKQKILEKEMKKDILNEKSKNKEKKYVLFSENLIKMIEKIFPDLLKLPEIKALNNNKENIPSTKVNTFLDYIFNNNFKENEVTPDKIISLINIDNYSAIEKNNYKPFSIPFYFQINVLEKGKYFGHTALETNSKEEITIITLQDSSFGIIEKNDYFRLLSKINKELDSNFYTTLYCLPFFKDIPKTVFQRFYYSYFEYHLYKRNNYLYEMKKNTNVLYLINNGRFSIHIYGNIIDLYNILIYLQTEKNNKLNKNKKILDNEEHNSKYRIIEKDEKEELIYNRSFKTKEFNEAVFAKNEIFLGCFEGNTLIGLCDFINQKTNIALFNVKIESNFSELYEITQKNFNTIITDYSFVKDIIEEFEIKKLNLIINKIIAYKDNFFASLEKKENDNICVRRNIKNKERQIAIFNKTQKSLKASRLNKELILPIFNDKKGKSSRDKYFTLGKENETLYDTFKSLGNKTTNNNFSEKKKRMEIKEKILKKQDNELFLLQNRDLNYKNKILELKNKILSNKSSKKTLSTNRDFSTKNDSKKMGNISINNNEEQNNLNIFTKDFFVDRIKLALYNNYAKSPFNRTKISIFKSEPRLYYINMIMNNNNISCKNILNKKKEDEKNKKHKNRSVGAAKNILKSLNLNLNNSKISNEKRIKIKSKLSYTFRDKETNRINLKINEYNKKEKIIFDKLKSNINKFKKGINTSTSYYTDRIKMLDSQKKLNLYN